jgi:hypothetical protein
MPHKAPTPFYAALVQSMAHELPNTFAVFRWVEAGARGTLLRF